MKVSQQLRASLREHAMFDRNCEKRMHAERVRDEVNKSPMKCAKINAMLSAAQALGMSNDIMERLHRLRAHHNNRYSEYAVKEGKAIIRNGGKDRVMELLEYYEGQVEPDMEEDK